MPKQKVDLKFILKQSLKEFRKKGYNHTSLQDIADACGLKKGSLYHYFKGGKSELMAAVIKFMHDFYNKEAFSYAYDDSLGVEQRLRILANISEEQYYASESGCLFGNLALETAGTIPELEEMVKSFFSDWINALTHIYQQKYDEETARNLAKVSVAEIEGAVMMMRIFADKTFLKRAHQAILDRLHQTPAEFKMMD